MNIGRGFYFAQITDIHIHDNAAFENERNNLTWALDEMENLDPKPALILATGDLGVKGTATELAAYRALACGRSVPIHALPANHDLWGEADESAWIKHIGPTHQKVVVNGVHFILINDTQRAEIGGCKGWKAQTTPGQTAWLEQQLREANGAPVVVAMHAPPLPMDGGYVERWQDSNADELFDLLSAHAVQAVITGHWHRNLQWQVKGVPVVNTGALCGWQYNEIPPYHMFPVRPGYRLFHFDGESLRSFWRDGPYWKNREPSIQTTLVSISGAHSGGPRPQVRPIDVFAKARLTATAYSKEGPIQKVEWSLVRNEWKPMERSFDGIWSEWEAAISPMEFRLSGSYPCVIRAQDAKGKVAYDAVPVSISERQCSPTVPVPAQAGPEKVFELFYMP